MQKIIITGTAMATITMFIAPQQLDVIKCNLGSDLSRALDLLTVKLNDMPPGKRQASQREFAELREAKSLISYLKYPDLTEPLRKDELAWALKYIAQSYRQSSHMEWVGLCGKIADMLDIDLGQECTIPAELNRRIGNELRIMRYESARVPVAAGA